MATLKQVLILTSAREPRWIDDAPTPVSKGLRSFIDKLNIEGDVRYFVSTLDKLDFTVTSNEVRIHDRFNDIDLEEYDLIHFRNVTLFSDFARAITIYMSHKGKRVVEEIDVVQPEYGKLSQMVLFALKGLPVPETWAAWHPKDLATLYGDKCGKFPFILKANDGIKGHDNYLVKSAEELDEIITGNPELQFVAQTYIPNDSDYRVLLFGDSETLIFSRRAAAGSHLNNTSRGGLSQETREEDFATEALNLAKEAATATRRKLSGVDLMQNSETGRWYVLEVNANPALSSGDLLENKLTGYKKMIGDLL